MTKKLLIAGCSHSVGFKLNQDEKPWFKLFAEKYNYDITNVAQQASSISYSINAITEKLAKEHFDLVFFQLTDFGRLTIGVDGKESFLNDRFIETEISLEYITLARYLEAVDKNELHIKFLYENVMYSTNFLKNIINKLFLLQNFCKFNNIKLVLIPYDSQNWAKESNFSIWNIKHSDIIDKKTYINEPFLKWLKTNYNYNDYFLDKGFHLNQEGQKLFTFKYLIPNLKKLFII